MHACFWKGMVIRHLKRISRQKEFTNSSSRTYRNTFLYDTANLASPFEPRGTPETIENGEEKSLICGEERVFIIYNYRTKSYVLKKIRNYSVYSRINYVELH
jgi:hypothetical protein